MDKTKPQPVNTVDAILNNAATKTESKTKAQVITFPAPLTEASRLKEASIQLEQTKTEVAVLQNELLQKVETFYKDALKRSFHSSIRVKGTGAEDSILITWKSAYSKVPYEYKDKLKELTGKHFDTMFEPKREITVKDTLSKEKLEELVNLIGPEKIKEFFNIELNIAPTDEFSKTRYIRLDDQTNTKLDEIVKQYRPTLKTQ